MGTHSGFSQRIRTKRTCGIVTFVTGICFVIPAMVLFALSIAGPMWVVSAPVEAQTALFNASEASTTGIIFTRSERQNISRTTDYYRNVPNDHKTYMFRGDSQNLLIADISLTTKCSTIFALSTNAAAACKWHGGYNAYRVLFWAVPFYMFFLGMWGLFTGICVWCRHRNGYDAYWEKPSKWRSYLIVGIWLVNFMGLLIFLGLAHENYAPQLEDALGTGYEVLLTKRHGDVLYGCLITAVACLTGYCGFVFFTYPHDWACCGRDARESSPSVLEKPASTPTGDVEAGLRPATPVSAQPPIGVAT